MLVERYFNELTLKDLMKTARNYVRDGRKTRRHLQQTRFIYIEKVKRQPIQLNLSE